MSARTPPARREKVRLAVLCCASALLAAEPLTLAYLCRTNTLYANGRWESGKVQLQRGVMGAVAFLTTTTAVSRNRLDLGAWHGFQEVTYKQPIDLRQLDFDFSVGKGGYLSLIHHRDEHQFQGVRVSDDPRYPAQTFTATVDGELLERAALKAAALKAGWNHMRAVFDSDGEHRYMSLTLNDAPLPRTQLPAASGGRQRFGFRAGLEPVLVDNVEIRDAAGTVVHEGFDNPRPRAPVFFAMFLAVLVLDLVLLSRRVRLPPHHTNAIVLACAALFFPIDFFYISALHPKMILDFAGYKSTIETRPAALARLRAIPTSAGAQARDAGPKVHRVLFVGSSQVWGAGARLSDDNMVQKTCDRLNRDARGESWECINAGLPGERSPSLAALYADEWTALHPALVVVDLGSNDTDEAQLRDSLERIAAINTAQRIPTLFIPEPNSPESDQTFLQRKQAVVRAVAAHHDFPILDAPRSLGERYDDGFLWWDFVHLTSYGQRLVAEALAPEIRKALLPH